MSMPIAWVEDLLGRLAVRYGEAFTRQYTAAGIKADAVRADWADVLDGVSGASVKYALQYLPSDRPPNALQFRALCRQAPRTDSGLTAITDGGSKPDPRVVAKLREVTAKLRANADKPRRWTPPGSMGEVVAETPESTPMGEFRPIPESCWPPGMRNGGIARDFAYELLNKHKAGEYVHPDRLDAALAIIARHQKP